MSLTSGVPTLDVRCDEAFEAQVLAAARIRVRRAHGQIGGSRLVREAQHAHKWRRTAYVAAAAAFGTGLLWPVTSPQPDAPRMAQPFRVLRGEMLASLDAPSSQAH